MANNQKVFGGKHLSLNIGTTVVSGDPVMWGAGPLAIAGVAETSADTTTGMGTVDGEGDIYAVSVKGVITGPANQAVNVGDTIYFTAGHTPKLDKDSTAGVAWGIALGTSFPYTQAVGTQLIASGATGTIHVKVKTS